MLHEHFQTAQIFLKILTWAKRQMTDIFRGLKSRITSFLMHNISPRFPATAKLTPWTLRILESHRSGSSTVETTPGPWTQDFQSMNWMGDSNQEGSSRALGDLFEGLGLTASLLPQWQWRCQRSQLAWESGNNKVHFLRVDYSVGIFLSWGPQKPLQSLLWCHLSGSFLSPWGAKLAVSLWGFWGNLAGRKVLKPAWQARSCWSMGGLTENQQHVSIWCFTSEKISIF